MIIKKVYSKYVVFLEDSIATALAKISENKSRLIFVVTEQGILEGVLSDGDIRRWLISTDNIDLTMSVSSVMNADFIAISKHTEPEEIQALFSDKVLAVPVIDDNSRLVAVALPGVQAFEFEGRLVGEEEPVFIIAEIGNNHNGSLELAKKLIDLAAEAGADCAKFQMRDLQASYRDTNDASDDLGAQYTMDLLRRFQLQDDELFTAFDYCREKNLTPLCTPWDPSSLQKLEKYGLPGYKVASADFTNYELIDLIAQTRKPMICSTGMSTENDILDGVRHLQGVGAQYVLLHCNSTYPTPAKDINLRYMEHLKEVSNGLVGYSGHERGISVPIAAVALGAKVIEKHFTIDKNMEGNDHKVSLLPDEFKQMVKGIRQLEESMGTLGDRVLSQGELMNREVLAKSLVATVDIPAGTKIAREMIDIKSPGQGLQPNRKTELIGTVLKQPKKAGDYFYPADLEGESVVARNYSFKHKWGIPVRYHDLTLLSKMSNMDLLEIHLSYKDMEEDFRKFIKEPLDLDLVVHSPELFAGDHTLDLCSRDKEYRKRSLEELQKVIDLTRQLTPYFKRAKQPPIVTNVGGFSNHGHLSKSARKELYAFLHESLQQLDTAGVEIIPQTMPPFPWHFGGQQFHNILVDAEEIVEFCEENQMRVCLDISHSKLACTFSKVSVSKFLKDVSPYTAHYHIADAAGVDGEGLQIGDGEMDWGEFFEIVNEYADQATFIPEIWQGHKNNGEGGWIALQRLEAISRDS